MNVCFFPAYRELVNSVQDYVAYARQNSLLGSEIEVLQARQLEQSDPEATE